jgi:hypothetical protein
MITASLSQPESSAENANNCNRLSALGVTGANRPFDTRGAGKIGPAMKPSLVPSKSASESAGIALEHSLHRHLVGSPPVTDKLYSPQQGLQHTRE